MAHAPQTFFFPYRRTAKTTARTASFTAPGWSIWMRRIGARLGRHFLAMGQHHQRLVAKTCASGVKFGAVHIRLPGSRGKAGDFGNARRIAWRLAPLTIGLCPQCGIERLRIAARVHAIPGLLGLGRGQFSRAGQGET
jgi:hypothetical protein